MTPELVFLALYKVLEPLFWSARSAGAKQAKVTVVVKDATKRISASIQSGNSAAAPSFPRMECSARRAHPRQGIAGKRGGEQARRAPCTDLVWRKPSTIRTIGSLTGENHSVYCCRKPPFV